MRQESVSSDNDYSEEQYVTTQRLGFPRGSNLESEEDKKEKRWGLCHAHSSCD